MSTPGVIQGRHPCLHTPSHPAIWSPLHGAGACLAAISRNQVVCQGIAEASEVRRDGQDCVRWLDRSTHGTAHTCKSDWHISQPRVSFAAFQGMRSESLHADAHFADVLRVADAAVHDYALQEGQCGSRQADEPRHRAAHGAAQVGCALQRCM